MIKWKFWEKPEIKTTADVEKNVYYLEPTKPAFFGEIGLYHFYPDCKEITTSITEITSDDKVYNYRLCDACSKSHAKRAKRKLKKLITSIPEMERELEDNLSKSSLSDEEKSMTRTFANMSLMMGAAIYGMSATMNDEKPHSKHFQIERVRKSVLYAEKGIYSIGHDSPHDVSGHKRAELEKQISQGINGAIFNCGGNRDAEIELEQMGRALKAIVALDYQYTKNNKRIKDDIKLYLDICEIRSSLQDQAGYRMCDVNRVYNEYVRSR